MTHKPTLVLPGPPVAGMWTEFVRFGWHIRSISTAVLLINLATTACAQPPATIPPPERQKEIATLLEKTYNLGKLEGIAKKQDAVKKLLQASRDENLAEDERYVVLKSLMSVAADAGDAARWLEAANALVETYDVDPPKEKARLLVEFLKASKSGSQLKPAVEEAIAFSRTAADECRFADATALLAAADVAVRRGTGMDNLKKLLAATRDSISAREKEWKSFQAGIATLDANAEDPAANLAAGRWHAVQQSDWETAVPFLAKSADRKWKSAALLELAAPTEAMSQLAIADAWYAISETESGSTRTALLLHAGEWYEEVQPQLTSTLTKQLVAKRIAEIAPIRAAAPSRPDPKPPGPKPPASVTAGAWIDLLAWSEGVEWASRGFDWNNRIEGEPTRKGITLKSIPLNQYPIPAIIDGDYELEAAFTRHEGIDMVGIVFPVGMCNMRLEFGAVNGTVASVGWVEGKSPIDPRNPTMRRISPVDNHIPHQIRVRVTHDGERAGFKIDWDSERDFITWEGPTSSLSSYDDRTWVSPFTRHPRLVSGRGRVTYHTLRARTLSGSINRDAITDADREQDRKDGFIRLVGEKAKQSSSALGWERITFNQMNPESFAVDSERGWPMVTREFKYCDDFWGAHAPSRLSCPIPPGAKSFTAIGYNETSRTTNFQVFIDKEKAYESGSTDISVIKVDIPPKSSMMELVVDPAGDNFHDCSYWCFPRFHAVAAERLTNKMLDDHSGKLPFRIASHTVGFRTLTHNQPTGLLQSHPIHFQYYQPCDEFIFAHAPSTITYNVPEGMTRFTAVGYMALFRHHVKFEVWAEGRRIYQSPQAGIVPIDVKLPPSTKFIELKVDSLGDRSGDHSMWCYPRLYKK